MEKCFRKQGKQTRIMKPENKEKLKEKCNQDSQALVS